MRRYWVYGAFTGWLVIPAAGLLAMGANFAVPAMILFAIGATGLVAAHIALSTLIYRILKAGDLIEEAEDEALELTRSAAQGNLAVNQ